MQARKPRATALATPQEALFEWMACDQLMARAMVRAGRRTWHGDSG
ncbi:hypothetical protein EV13_0820 [Prochlorococcus sp. MIT 0702]|nr:hypothetical protein EV12_0665 [Prochlorococcus sp. MIT 0701]KGG29787.1 hypothetical protein EV13_0820 [Prochlorococcus sp. MIT 0702]KGG36435.1 hypothetical protein EV14_0350 [Prochlorococcus sp. MIT 0703]